MMDNMEIWNKVCKTDPKNTKDAKIGQMKITAICPQSQRRAATEIFGPFGHGWGVSDDKYEFIDFSNLTKLCTYTATFWYIIDSSISKFPIQANIKVAFVTQGEKGYLKIDDEYAKKVATDALTKGLSMLGFNSDVFEGKYDDNKYVNQMKQEHAPKPPKKVILTGPIVDSILTCPTVDSLKLLWETLDKPKQKTYLDLINERKKQLEAVKK